MNRPVFRRLPDALVPILMCVMGVGCDRAHPAGPQANAKAPTIASLVPSATDLLIGMGAGDHVVAVSNYDRDSNLPQVGDYQAIDWEKLSRLRPNLLVTFYGAGHAPPGTEERAGSLGMKILNLRFDRLTDLFSAIEILGEACDERSKAQAELQRIRSALHAVAGRVSGGPRVRAVIVTEASGLDFAGRSNYLDDLLEIAGGENCVTAPGYVTLDREAVAALAPQVILQLLPSADRETVAKTQAFWQSFPDLPAVKEHRVWLYTETYIMMPGSHVTEVAEKFAAALHPMPTPSTRPTADGRPS